MALQHRRPNTAVMNNINTENAILAKGAIQHGAIARSRTALGNISNKASALPQPKKPNTKAIEKVPLNKDVTKKPTTVATSRLTRSQATSSLLKLSSHTSSQFQVAEDIIEEVEPMNMSSVIEIVEEVSRTLLPPNVEDIDTEEQDDPQHCCMYVNDIYDYMRTLERQYPVAANYLESDTMISCKMRSILIDWLVQVHLKFRLLQETLFLTIGILDRYLQDNECSKTKLQLVGVTSMFIASKYEEMYAPEIADFVFITDNAYDKLQIRQMEAHMLKALNFSVGKPLCINFLRRNSKAGFVDAQIHTLAKYLMELSLGDYASCHIDPSQIAAASLCLSIRLLGKGDCDWTPTLEFYSKYTQSSLQPVVQRLAQLVLKAPESKLQAVYTKYQSSKFMKIAALPELSGKRIYETAGISS